MKIYYITFGCKVNSYETAAMRQCFIEAGFEDALSMDCADIFVINSCTVTAESDSKLMQTIRRLKRDYPEKTVMLTGCFPQAYPDKARGSCGADIITGTRNRLGAVNMLNEYLNEKKRLFRVEDISKINAFEPLSVSDIPGHTRAFVKIQDGCCRHCTYCIIPKSRGKICSKPPSDIIAEVRGLAQNGYREIVFVGINLAFYGAGMGIRLADAVEATAGVDGIERVRLSSLEPEMITDEDLKRLSAIKEFCPSFHLSLQSGCAETLKAMNRCYTPDEYEALVDRIRCIFPDCAVTTDIMTGFPGETDENHRKSMDFAEKIGFSDIHVFPYSQRKGTAADRLTCQIPMDVRKQRAAQMSALGGKLRQKYLESLVGKVYPVLFEREKSPFFHGGYSPNYAYVKILTKNSEKSLRKQIFYVKIDKIEDCCCVGHIVDDICQ